MKTVWHINAFCSTDPVLGIPQVTEGFLSQLTGQLLGELSFLVIRLIKNPVWIKSWVEKRDCFKRWVSLKSAFRDDHPLKIIYICESLAINTSVCLIIMKSCKLSGTSIKKNSRCNYAKLTPGKFGHSKSILANNISRIQQQNLKLLFAFQIWLEWMYFTRHF